MKTSSRGVDLVKSFEAYMRPLPNGDCVAYRCVVGRDKAGHPIYDGKWTIGWGCTEGITEGTVWTRERAEQGLRIELEKAERIVARHVTVDLNQNQFDALVSFAYNVGEGSAKVPGFSTSTLLKCVNRGDAAGAARAFGMWVNSNGVKNVPGLVARRAREAALFLEPADAADEPLMPQTVDAPPAAPVGSRKMAVTNVGEATATTTAITIFGLHIADALGYSDKGLALVKTYGVGAALTAAVVVVVGCAVLKHLMRQDHAEGRAISSWSVS